MKLEMSLGSFKSVKVVFVEKNLLAPHVLHTSDVARKCKNLHTFCKSIQYPPSSEPQRSIGNQYSNLFGISPVISIAPLALSLYQPIFLSSSLTLSSGSLSCPVAWTAGLDARAEIILWSRETVHPTLSGVSALLFEGYLLAVAVCEGEGCVIAHFEEWSASRRRYEFCFGG